MNLNDSSLQFTQILTDSSQAYNFTLKQLENWGIIGQTAHLLNAFIWIIILIITLLLIQWITNKFIITSIIKIIKRTKNNFDDFIVKNKTLNHIGRYIPLSVTKFLIPIVFFGYPDLIKALIIIIEIAMIITLLTILKSILKTLKDILETKPSFVDKPLGSYLQVLNIFMLFVGGTIIFSIITGSSPWAFLASLGAASAILMLVFKDTILGFVASVQVSVNDSIRTGDWIEMTKHGADGQVIEISLNNIKVQNWDKTITVVPTHLLLSDAVKNWRGMQESGGRRIKRSINIKIATIRFLTEEEITKLESIAILKNYIEQRQLEISEFNTQIHIDETMPINGRRMTNIGLFRAYVMAYVQQNPNIRQDMTLLVRHLAPTEKGLPLELYMFTNDIRWAFYESIMADIFDHLFATIKYFHLEVYEAPASDDIRNLQLSNVVE